ncbi:MAG TPA: coenzyme F420-0:L-glutamate ligase [Candidatus Saccharimonadales bacterium]|nr:coenzyme F420-0:L-glutamate ligase [Candidatus Saccharimonadales bacterium]
MKVSPIKTEKVLPGKQDIYSVLDTAITRLGEKSVVVITSKILALCEGRVVAVGSVDKEELIKRESDYYLPATISKYGYHFTIVRNTLISVAGIDESNSGGDYYVLWPKDPQQSANDIRPYLRDKFSLRELGVVITDSTSLPMRRGTLGIPIGYSGFSATNNYVGTPDLFGRDFTVSHGGIAIGLAAAGALAMGEGTEQTPIAVVDDFPLIHFEDHDPTPDELDELYIDRKEDLYEPFISKVEWQKGGRSNP